MRELVSVVIPVHNGGSHLSEAVSSALGQDYDNLEVIVVDNASTDGCADRLADLADPRLTVHSFNTLIPAHENWTKAVDLASGTYIKLLCADDALLPGCISLQVAHLAATPTAGIASGRRRIVRESGETMRTHWGLHGLRGLVPGCKALRACVLSGANPLGEPAAVMFRGHVLRSCMPWSPTAGYVIDVEMYLRVLETTDLWASEQVVALFRLSSGSWSTSVAKQQARDTSRLIDQVHARQPDCVSGADAHRGRLKSRAAQWLRGLVYFSERVRT